MYIEYTRPPFDGRVLFLSANCASSLANCPSSSSWPVAELCILDIYLIDVIYIIYVYMLYHYIYMYITHIKVVDTRGSHSWPLRW